jgi:hypothetical protein
MSDPFTPMVIVENVYGEEEQVNDTVNFQTLAQSRATTPAISDNASEYASAQSRSDTPIPNSPLLDIELLLDSEQLRVLKRALVNQQVCQELEYLKRHMSLHELQKLPDQIDGNDPLPFLRYVFQRYVLTFPLFCHLNPSFWQQVQSFLDQLVANGIGQSRERQETQQRQQMMKRIERMITLLYYTGIKTLSGMDTSTSSDLVTSTDTLDTSHTTSTNMSEDTTISSPQNMNQLIINVVSVRSVHVEGRIRDSKHSEFICIKTLSRYI